MSSIYVGYTLIDQDVSCNEYATCIYSLTSLHESLPNIKTQIVFGVLRHMRYLHLHSSIISVLILILAQIQWLEKTTISQIVTCFSFLHVSVNHKESPLNNFPSRSIIFNGKTQQALVLTNNIIPVFFIVSVTKLDCCNCRLCFFNHFLSFIHISN